MRAVNIAESVTRIKLFQVETHIKLFQVEMKPANQIVVLISYELTFHTLIL